MNTKPSFGIIRSFGDAGRVYIEGMGSLESVWLFADVISFSSFQARLPQCECNNEIGNVVVFSGISNDDSWRGVDAKFDGNRVISRVAAIVDVLCGFTFPVEPSLFCERHFSPPLIEAAKINDLSLVKQLLNQGCDPNSAGSNANTALLHAVAANNYELVTLLTPCASSLRSCQISRNKRD